ncbi:MAG: hypothetical protein ACM3NV_01560 [Syntrophothermus sp.]
MQRDSDLAYLPVVVGLIAAVAVVFLAFFFIGPVLGVILLIAAVILGLIAGARFIGRNDVS